MSGEGGAKRQGVRETQLLFILNKKGDVIVVH